MKRWCLLFLIPLTVLVAPQRAEAAWLYKDNKFVEVEERASLPPEGHYALGIKAWNCQDWEQASYQFRVVITNYPAFVSRNTELLFYSGAAYFYRGELDMAEDEFAWYLRASCSPEFLEETMEYKLAIADQFRSGAKRRFFGSKRLPKWVCGKSHALKIYDEIVSTLPCHDLAALALFSKGCLLCEIKDFSCSIEAYQMLIRRFPLHELAPESYLAIMQTYLQQAHCEYQNSDILALGEIVLRKFKEDFPNEERIAAAEDDMAQIEEVYAYGLYETAVFYERRCKPQASALYYASTIRMFPDTVMADNARQRLCSLLKCHPCVCIPEGTLDDVCEAI